MVTPLMVRAHTGGRERRLEPGRADLSVGILLVPNFTLLAFAGFVDTLRLAADEGDRSRPVRCRWHVMTANGQPVRSSCGTVVAPTDGLVDPGTFDYVVTVGGILHGGPTERPAVHHYLQEADRQQVPLIGLCTGSFVMARAGLMDGRRTCVSWLHYDDFVTEFPRLTAFCDRLYFDDRDRITCAGGTSVIHLASMLVDRHCGPRRSEKGLRIMIEEQRRPAAAPQPARGLLPPTADRLVRRALLLAEQRTSGPVSVESLAAQLGTSRRNLERRFRSALGRTPRQCLRALQLDRAKSLVVDSALSMTEIADLCGFASASHFSRAFRLAYAMPPLQTRTRVTHPRRPDRSPPDHGRLSGGAALTAGRKKTGR